MSIGKKLLLHRNMTAPELDESSLVQIGSRKKVRQFVMQCAVPYRKNQGIHQTLKRAGQMTRLKLRDLVSLDAMAILAAIVLCVILGTDPALLG